MPELRRLPGYILLFNIPVSYTVCWWNRDIVCRHRREPFETFCLTFFHSQHHWFQHWNEVACKGPCNQKIRSRIFYELEASIGKAFKVAAALSVLRYSSHANGVSPARPTGEYFFDAFKKNSVAYSCRLCTANCWISLQISWYFLFLQKIIHKICGPKLSRVGAALTELNCIKNILSHFCLKTVAVEIDAADTGGRSDGRNIIRRLRRPAIGIKSSRCLTQAPSSSIVLQSERSSELPSGNSGQSGHNYDNRYHFTFVTIPHFSRKGGVDGSKLGKGTLLCQYLPALQPLAGE